MTGISAIIVDDSDADRYIARRMLARAEGFGEPVERISGDDFLTSFYQPPLPVVTTTPPMLVLMDISMPGRDGFETLEALEAHMVAGDGPDKIIVFMCTSSANPKDIARAKDFGSVAGYITKPLSSDSLERIRATYRKQPA